MKKCKSWSNSSKIPSELSSAVNSTTIWYQTRLHYMQSLQLCMPYFWNTLLTDILFFRSHLHIFGTITFAWTKSHLHPIIHLHTKYQDCMCSGSWAFDRDGHTYIPTYLHTYIHTDIQTYRRHLDQPYNLTLVYIHIPDVS